MDLARMPDVKRYLFLLATVSYIASAQAQSVKEIERREAELIAAWEKTPLSFRKAVFVTEKAPIYGAYAVRSNNIFQKGDPLLVYLEPVGYAWQQDGENQLLSIKLDVEIKSKNGKSIGGKDGFLDYNSSSRHKLRELMLNVTITYSDLPAGEYSMNLVGHDIDGRTGSVSLPFKVVK